MVVTDTLLVCSHLACVLFNLGFTHSYVSPVFAINFERNPSKLDHELIVGTPMGHTL